MSVCKPLLRRTEEEQWLLANESSYGDLETEDCQACAAVGSLIMHACKRRWTWVLGPA